MLTKFRDALTNEIALIEKDSQREKTTKGKRIMPVNREAMIDWIMNVPDDAEIGTDEEGVTLLAIRGTNVHWLAVGRLPYAKELYCEGSIR